MTYESLSVQTDGIDDVYQIHSYDNKGELIWKDIEPKDRKIVTFNVPIWTICENISEFLSTLERDLTKSYDDIMTLFSEISKRNCGRIPRKIYRYGSVRFNWQEEDFRDWIKSDKAWYPNRWNVLRAIRDIGWIDSDFPRIITNKNSELMEEIQNLPIQEDDYSKNRIWCPIKGEIPFSEFYKNFEDIVCLYVMAEVKATVLYRIFVIYSKYDTQRRFASTGYEIDKTFKKPLKFQRLYNLIDLCMINRKSEAYTLFSELMTS